MELKLASLAGASKPLHRIQLLHTRFWSFVAAIFFLLWLSSLLHFHSSGSHIPHPPSSSTVAPLIDEPSSSYAALYLKFGFRNPHKIGRFGDRGAPRAAAHSSNMQHVHHFHGRAHRADTFPSKALSPPSSSPPNSALPAHSSSLPSVSTSPAISESSLPTTVSASPAAPSTPSASSSSTYQPSSGPLHQSCDGKYVYMHSLPPMFNQDMISNCTLHSPPWADFCSLTANGGLGPVLHDENGVLTLPDDGIHSWYNTGQFNLDVIFHSRMKKYACLTRNSSEADLVYVPFYAGLDITKYLWYANVSTRDYLPNALANWLTEQPEWRSMEGRDHFFVTGKISWDFRRPSDEESNWGNKLLELQPLKNVSVLLIEKGPAWASHLEHAIPYPTYFHPRTDSEVFDWQNRMRALKRINLFAFAGASRPEFADSIRGDLIEQCRTSTVCKLLECTRGTSGCNSPTTVMKLFQESVFCLQPAGDSYTRRSVFDSMVSGCIPVLFHPRTAYTQYTWHLPKNFSAYSVFIPEEDIRAKTAVIESILQRISAPQIEDMREKVISLIPTLIYAHPDNKLEKVKDAFDVAMEALLTKVSASKQENRLSTHASS